MTLSSVSFIVEAKALPQGSKNVNRHTGVMYETQKGLHAYRDLITREFERATSYPSVPRFLLDTDGLALKVRVIFGFPRPQSHYKKSYLPDKILTLRPDKHADALTAQARTKWAYMTQKPDVDKLQRAVGDALTQAVFRRGPRAGQHIIVDDSRIVAWDAMKVWLPYGTAHRVLIQIDPMFPALEPRWILPLSLL